MSETSSTSQSVAAIIPESQMSAVLTAVHRAGFGHRARVVRSTGTSERAVLFGRALSPDESLLIIQAAAASERVHRLLLGIGVEQVSLFEESENPSTVLSIDRHVFGRRARRQGRRKSPGTDQYPITETNVSSE